MDWTSIMAALSVAACVANVALTIYSWRRVR